MVLKRTAPEVLQVDLGHLRLWRDDLAKIVKLLDECAQSRMINADEWQLDDVEDLAGVETTTIGTFTYSGDGGRVQLRLGPRVAFLEINQPDLAARGVAAEIQKITRERRVLPQNTRLILLGVLAICLVAAGALLFRFVQSHQKIGTTAWAIAAALATIVSTTWLNMIAFPKLRRVTIYRGKRVEAPTFWERKKDDIWINAVALVVGGVIGYFVGKL